MANEQKICPACGLNTLKFFSKKARWMCLNEDCGEIFPEAEIDGASSVIQELESGIPGVELSQMPSVLAIPLQEYIDESNPVLKLWHACDVMELTLRLLVIVGLADISREGELPKELLGELRSRIEEPTLGKWRGMAEAVAKRISKTDSVVPELADLVNDVLVPFLDGTEEQRTPENSFSGLRNQLAHGGGVTKAVARRLLAIWQPKFEEMITRATWLGELSLVIRDDAGNFGVLRSPNRDAVPYQPDHPEVVSTLQEAFERGEEVVLVRESTVLPLWPLTLYGLPRSPDPDAPPPRESTPQVYVRRGEVRLQFTPVGSEEVCQSEGDETTLNAFLRVFRWDEVVAQERAKAFEVRGFEADIRKDSEKLVGRAEELSIIRKALTETSEGVLWLTGPAGIGKSYLVSRITAELLEEPPEKTLVLPYRFKAGDDRCSRNSFLRFAIERIKAWERSLKPATPPAEEGEEEDKKQKKPIDELKELLNQLGDNRVHFILDGLDEIAERDKSFAEEIPLDLTFPGVTWFCAGRPEQGLPEVFTPERCRHLFPEGVPLMDTGDIRTMLLEKIGPLRKRLLKNDREEGEQVINPFIERVAEYAEGLPLYVTYVIGDILSNRFRALDAGERLPPSLEAYHEELLRRCSVGTLHQVMTPLAATLAAAKEPLTAEALGVLLERRTLVPEGERGLQLVRQGLSSIASMLKRAFTPEGKEGYTLFHNSLRQHMAESETSRDAVDTARQALCQAALNIGDDAAATYLYRQGVTHLLEAGRTDDALGLLTNFDFVRAKVESGMLFSLVSDYQATLPLINSSELESWSRFIDSESHIFSRYSHLFFQQALNQPADSPIAQAAETRLTTSPPHQPYLRWLNKPQKTIRSPLLRTLAGHTRSVKAVAITPDGRYVVSGSADRTLKVWALASGREVATLEGHTGLVYAVAVTPDGRYAVSGSADKTVKVWELSSRQEVVTLEGHREEVKAVAVTPDGRHMVSGSDYMTVKVWDLASGQKVATLAGHMAHVNAVAVSPDSRYAVSGSYKTLKVWDLRSGKEVATLKGHTDWIRAVAVTPDGRYAVSGSRDKTLRVWEFESGREVAMFPSAGQGDTCAANRKVGVVYLDEYNRLYILRLEGV